MCSTGRVVKSSSSARSTKDWSFRRFNTRRSRRMSAVATQFNACRPKLWTGRYARVPGNSSVFHLRHTDMGLWPVLIWNKGDEIATCPAIASPVATSIAAAVANAKRHTGGDGPGAFTINEFGQVLVPASDGDG